MNVELVQAPRFRSTINPASNQIELSPSTGIIVTINRPILLFKIDVHLGYTFQRVFLSAGYLAKIVDNAQEFADELKNNTYRYIIVNQQSLDWESLLLLLQLPNRLKNKTLLIFLVSDERMIPKMENQANLEVKYLQVPINPSDLLQIIFGQQLRDGVVEFFSFRY